MTYLSAPVRQVRFPPADVECSARPDGSLVVRPLHPLGPYPDKLTERLDHWAAAHSGSRFLGRARPQWRMAHGDLRSDARGSQCRAGAARAAAISRPPHRDSLRQRYRTRRARTGRHVRGHPFCAHLSGVFAGVLGFRKAAIDLRHSYTRLGVCFGRRAVPQGHPGCFAAGRRACDQRRSRRAICHAILRF